MAAAIESSAEPAHRGMHFAAYEVFYNAHLLPLVASYGADDRFTVLDIGCGDGRVANAIGRHFPNAEVLGIDDDPGGLTLAAKSAPSNVTFQRGRAEALPAFGSYDVVICSEVFEHVDDPDGLLAACAAALLPGGLMSFSTPSGWMMRQPRIVNVGLAVRRPKEFWIRLYPERRWLAALPKHPGSRASVLRQKLDVAGFEVLTRSSSLVRIEPDWPSLLALGGHGSWFLRVARVLGGRSAEGQVQKAHHLYLLCEGAMNVLPGLRWMESRVFLTARKR